jgi:MoaA/NifB/PqqE/SkfB family radical SAM enzyme
MKLRKDSDGILFFDKKSGINILFDEIAVAIPDIAPRHMSIAVTNACNLNCGYCYIHHDKYELSIVDVKKWIDELNRSGCLSIGLGGGEPTLWNHIVEIIDYISSTEMAVTMTTNGSANVNFYLDIIEKLDLIRFSIDGLYSIYEKNRNQCFVDIIDKIKILKTKGDVGINYLLTDETVLQLDQFALFAKTLKPHEILLIPCLNKKGQRALSNKSIYFIQLWLDKYRNIFPLAFSYSGFDIVKNYALPIQDFNNIKQCHYFMHINAKGELMKNAFNGLALPIKESIIDSILKFGGL